MYELQKIGGEWSPRTMDRGLANPLEIRPLSTCCRIWSF